MVAFTSEIVAFLASLPLFQGLSETEISQIARKIRDHRFTKGSVLFSQENHPENFYILWSGSVSLSGRSEDGTTDVAILEPGDTIGAEELIFQIPRLNTATALENSTLLYFSNIGFDWLTSTFEQIKLNLTATANTHQRARKLKFNWISNDEVIHLISQRHIIHLIINLLRPTALLLPGGLALTFFFFAPTMATQLFASVFSALVIIAALLWIVWFVIDWRNDYFIITSQRVVALEQVLLQHASREEAPLSTIQTVLTETDMLGRIFNYGNVIVRTFTGSMVMDNVANPEHIKRQIEDLISRANTKSKKSRLETIRYTIQESLGQSTDSDEQPIQVLPPLSPPPESPRSLGIFKTRQVDGDIFIYHKHWFDLLIKTWPTMLFVFGISLAAIGLVWRNLNSAIYPPSSTTLIIASIAIFVPAINLVYHYLDWKNDHYSILKDSVIDREKKPFGTEVSKSALLNNILSLNHEKRGILGILLNFGDVNINVGDATLTFHNVHDPAQVQQDIFYRMEKQKREATLRKEEDERERMTDWIKTYHEVQNAEGNHT